MKEPKYKQLPQIFVENMESEIRDIRKLILLYVDKINRIQPSAKSQLLGVLLSHEQELLDVYMKDYKEMREYYAAQGIIDVS
jgi:hypothetical protein